MLTLQEAIGNREHNRIESVSSKQRGPKVPQRSIKERIKQMSTWLHATEIKWRCKKRKA